MTRGGVRRLGAAGLALGCLIALPGQADAVPAPPTVAVGAAVATEGQAVAFTITRAGTDEDLTVPTVVSVATSDGTAVAGEDYTTTTATIEFAAGETSKPFNVPTTDDEFDEPNETFTVTVTVVANGTPGSTSATGTIADGDAPPTLAISGPASVDEVAGNAAYSVAITGKSAATVRVDYATANGTATATQDYGQTGGTLSWESGDTNPKSFVVPILHDTLDEIDETFSVNLSNPTGATITTGTATTSITDNDDEPTVSAISDVTVLEGNAGTVDAAITLTLSAASGKTVTVPYSTAPGTATEGTDFEAKTGNVVFVPGEDLTETIIVKVKGDTLFEPEERFSVVITDPINGALGPDNRGEITITDDDSSPTPTVTNPSVPEGNSGLTDLVFEVSLACPRPQVSFNYRTVADTATSSDFTEIGGAQLTFPACSTTATTKLTITIKVKGDTLDELDESFNLELLNPTTGAVVKTAKGTITNDDNNSKLSISDATADEPSAGTTTMKFTVTLSPASDRAVSVNWATADGTATPGVDYTAASGVLSFAAGETSKTIDVAVIGDTINEENETLKIVLSNPTGVPAANLLDPQGNGTIIDKNAPPTLSISDVLSREGEGATFTVTLAGTTLRTVTVGFNTADGTAKAGSDYAARVGTLTFAPGEKSKTIAVTVIDDTAAEPVEEFFVVLGDPTNGTITKNRGQASIEASDRSLEPAPAEKPPVAKPAAVLVPRMILGPRTVPVGANGIARMLVTCQKVSPIGCAGTVELERAVKPLLKLGKRTFAVKKGTKGYASIRLSARALKILRKNGTLRAKVIVLVKTSTKTMKVSPGIITLKRVKTAAQPKAPPPTTKVVVDP